MSNKAKSKRQSRRLARKRAMRWLSNVTHDSMRAARRLYGQGLPK